MDDPIRGPGLRGMVPEEVKQIRLPNDMVLLLGRLRVEGDNDLTIVYGLEGQMQLPPLSYRPCGHPSNLSRSIIYPMEFETRLIIKFVL